MDDWHRRTNNFPFHSLIMLDPPLISAVLDLKYGNFNAALATKARRRRTRWSSLEEAVWWFHKQQKSWDPRCSRLFAVRATRFLFGACSELSSHLNRSTVFAEHKELHVKWSLVVQVNKKPFATAFLNKTKSSKFCHGSVLCFQYIPSSRRSLTFVRE